MIERLPQIERVAFAGIEHARLRHIRLLVANEKIAAFRQHDLSLGAYKNPIHGWYAGHTRIPVPSAGYVRAARG